MRHLISIAILCGLAVPTAAAFAQPVDAAPRELVVDAGPGVDGPGVVAVTDAPAPAPAPVAPALAAAPTDTTATPAPAPSIGDVLGQLGDLKAQYDALKANKDKSLTTLLWVGLIAALLKVLLSAMNAIWPSPKKWTAWIALGLAAPIALLSHFAAGHTWVDSAVFALAGPGAIAIHELLKLFAKKTT